MVLPRLILTSGEPAGIGPDLCISMAAHPWACDLVVAADTQLLEERARQMQRSVRFIRFAPDDERRPHEPGTLRVLHVPARTAVRAGRLDPANGGYVLNLLDAAIDGCAAGDFDALVTAPVQKSVINDAGVPFSGHTEYLAERTGGAQPVMLLVAGRLRVALATTHLPLSEVSRSITPERLQRILQVLDHDLRTRFAIAAPRILVCGLNPHAGESGHLGREEIDVIAPTLRELRDQGLDVRGPAPADTAFTAHSLEQVDAVLAMFHDQGLPVVKYAGFGTAINVTLGLPIIRTSVDHGTALDLAGTGRADAGSLAAALKLAIELAEQRAVGRRER